MNATDTTGLIDVGDLRLYHERRGTGPALVLVHGGTVDGGFYDEVADLLADEFTVVTYDRRGNSRSPAPRHRGTDIPQQSADLAALIDTLGVAPATVWASSVGAVIALDLLCRRPDLVRTLIVHEPPLFSALDGPERVIRQLSDDTAAAIRQGGLSGALEAHARQELGAAFDRLSPKRRQRMFGNAEVFFTVELPGFLASMPDAAILAERLRGTRVPVFAAAASDSADGLLRTTAQWVADHAGNTLRELPGGHLPHVSEPVATAELIRSLATSRRNSEVPATQQETGVIMSDQQTGVAPQRESLGFTQPPGHTASAIRPAGAAPRGYAVRARVSGFNLVLPESFQQTEVAAADESGVSLVRYGMTEKFSGGVTGTGTASHVSVVRKDGTTTITGVERIVGTVDGRQGSFVITDAAYHDRYNMTHGRWTVVEGSGTGELAGLRGEGEFDVTLDGPTGPLSVYNLTYWFEDEDAQAS
ncbi:alpha/beta fold hydrolase [Nocardia mexicana]|uniref:Pimeloyl-ACP methyl ester carboxylesterase n=1 Tax=Nocardia mexicana TaxID=279262 RepID=A0A370GTY4_9NOCA|nr:alpha/beta fold hydrolase [Nocardia mexicana]RDI46760.1 pimeloyl-ACP methyl ester carboxylesterase [Nocardia mexicana]